MKNQRSKIGNQASTRGFTIVECLIGLAIAAMLLAAVAAAFNASIVSYRENEQMFWSMNNARQALTRMTNEIRPSGYFDGTTWYGMAHTAAPSDHCTFYLANHELITYRFNSTEKKLYLVKNATNQTYVLCNDVTNATFTTMSDNGVDAKSVIITLTVHEGGSDRTLSAAAVLRRFPAGV